MTCGGCRKAPRAAPVERKQHHHERGTGNGNRRPFRKWVRRAYTDPTVFALIGDLDSVLAQVEDAGIPLLIGRKTGVDNNHQAWIADPDGNRIEFMQMTPNAMQLEALARLRKRGNVAA